MVNGPTDKRHPENGQPQPAPPEGLPSETLPAVLRLLDANLDRAREGLRVLEDWARFGLGRAALVERTKDMRQRLGRCHRDRYKQARHAATDPATGLGHPAQQLRLRPEQVVAANAARVQEALRVLEEFGRGVDPELAAEAASLRYGLYDLELELLGLHAGGGDWRRELLQRCHLYLVTGPVAGLEERVEAALGAGLRLVQYRAKEGSTTAAGTPLTDADRLAQARALRQLCSRHGALFLVNDRIDLALAVEADGVHLGQGDLPPAVARQLLGPDRLVGRSTHALPQLRQAVADGCDYVGVGPVNATPSKPGREPVGLAYVRQACAEQALPCFAIGGITSAAVPELQDAGASRVAVVRAITEAGDAAVATRALLEALGSEH
ncbi:MAG: thiamine phosphate synthase [Cyanobacteria bacterium M_surface_10_m2_119]|nr:thiamine phosphate synthase [Cyanobacteria bacterium M_surface_10_m2_119]